MQLRNSLIVYRKELRDMLRDKRTIRSMVIIPMIAFPLLTVGISYLGVQLGRNATKDSSLVMIQGGEDSPKILAALHNQSDLQIVPYQNDAKKEVSDKKIGALVQIPIGFDSAINSTKPEQVSIGYYENELKSEAAQKRVQKFFEDYRDQIVRKELAARGLPASLLQPFTVDAENVAPPAKVSAAAIGGMVFYFVIILAFSGGMYPAMDLTAGEKERGTMETILSSPVSRTDLVFGKFLMVLTASLSTTILSLLSMGASLAWAKTHLPHEVTSSLHMTTDLSSISAIIVLLLPLAILFAAILIAVALLAKSYREAQTYVSPMVFVVIMPAIVGALPGVELNWKTALVPILNTSLVSKEVLSGTYHWGYLAGIFAMTCLYAGIGLAAAVHMFNREDVLFRA
jgi:sodium transport system permease protein